MSLLVDNSLSSSREKGEWCEGPAGHERAPGCACHPPAAKAPGAHQADEDLLLLVFLAAGGAQAAPPALGEGEAEVTRCPHRASGLLCS